MNPEPRTSENPEPRTSEKGPRMSKPRTSENEPRTPNVRKIKPEPRTSERYACAIFLESTGYKDVRNDVLRCLACKYNYTNTAIGEMALNPIKCYILEKPLMQGCYKWYFELSNMQIQNTNIKIHVSKVLYFWKALGLRVAVMMFSFIQHPNDIYILYNICNTKYTKYTIFVNMQYITCIQNIQYLYVCNI